MHATATTFVNGTPTAGKSLEYTLARFTRFMKCTDKTGLVLHIMGETVVTSDKYC